MGNDAKRRVRDGTALALRLMQQAGVANRSQPGQPLGEPIRLGSKPLLTLGVAAAVIVIGGLIAVGVIAGMLKVFEYGVGPLLGYVVGLLFPLLFIPGALPVLAAAVLVIALLLAPRFREPSLFLGGLLGPLLAIFALRQVPALIAALRARGHSVELEGPVLIVSLIVCAFLFVGGLQLMGTAEWIGKRSDNDDDDDDDDEPEPSGISSSDHGSVIVDPAPPER